jgi:hypothetical protein
MCHSGNSKNIAKLKTPIGMTSEKRYLTNMRDGHTCSISSVDLVGPMIDLMRVKLAELAGQMIHGGGINVLVWVNRVGLSMSLGLLRRRAVSHGSLTRIIARILAIIAKAEDALLEAAVALGGPVSLQSTQLAYTPTPT